MFILCVRAFVCKTMLNIQMWKHIYITKSQLPTIDTKNTFKIMELSKFL